MKQEILQIFYNQVVPEANTGLIQIGGWNFNIRFFLKIKDLPIQKFDEKKDYIEFIPENKEIVITVQNIETFHELLVEYTEKMYAFIVDNPKFYNIDNLYFEGNRENILKGILSTVWINATEENFKNPEQFLKMRIQFLEDENSLNDLNAKFIGEKIGTLDDSQIEVEIKKQNPFAHETPYVFTSQIQKELNGNIETFNLPNISYGIYDDKCYIYSIQNKSKKNDQLTPYQKKINRLLYQANKDVLDDYEEENIRDISQPHLFALTIFLKFINVEKVVVPCYLPIRYNAKIRVLNNKLNQIKDYTEKQVEDIKQELEKDVDKIQENIIQKYLRTFRRLEYHFPNFKIVSFPYDVDNNMHIHIKREKYQNQDHVLYDVYNSMNFEKEIDKKR